MAQDNTLTLVAIAAAVYFLFIRKPSDTAAVVTAPASAPVNTTTIIKDGRQTGGPLYYAPYPDKRLPYAYSIGQQIQLAYGQAPPVTPYGYVWVAMPTGAQPAEGATVTWTLRATRQRFYGPPITATA